METFWFIVLSFLFLAAIARLANREGLTREKTSVSINPRDRQTNWMLFLNQRTEPGIFVRNLKTDEQIFLPSPVRSNEKDISSVWIVGLLSCAVALGCLAGFILYAIWDFLLYSF